MDIDKKVAKLILTQILSLSFWKDFWNRTSVIVVGSIGAGMGDSHSDLDIHILVPVEDYRPLYDLYKKGADAGKIDILNPRAFLFDEFPLVNLSGIDGHYQVLAFELIEEKMRAFNDVERWVYLNSESLHDSSGRFESLKEETAEYPPDVLNPASALLSRMGRGRLALTSWSNWSSCLSASSAVRRFL